MSGNQFFGILARGSIEFFIVIAMQQKVITHTATYKRPLYTRHTIDRPVKMYQRTMIDLHIGTHRRPKARRPFTYTASRRFFTGHTIHIGRGAAQIAEIAFKVGHSDDFRDFPQNRLLRTGRNKFALMRRNRTKSATAETAPMQGYRKFYHLKCRYGFPPVTRVWQPGKRQVIYRIELLTAYRR